VVGALLIALLRRHALSALVPYTTLFRSTAIAPGHGLLASSGAHHGAGWNKPWFKTFTLACSWTIRVHSFGPVKALALRPLPAVRSEEHTSELQSREKLVCRLLLEKIKTN